MVPSSSAELILDGSAAGADHDAVVRLLGRSPKTAYEVVVRRRDGAPLVIRNAPFEADATPMPTLYWLLTGALHDAISALEAAGGVREAESEVGLEAIETTHGAARRERDDLIEATARTLGLGPDAPRPSGGVGGTRRGVKCLHAHVAHHLAHHVAHHLARRVAHRSGDPAVGADGAADGAEGDAVGDPVGAWTLSRLGLRIEDLIECPTVRAEAAP